MFKFNPNSHLKAKEREHLSFPAKFIYNQNLMKGEILDFGCGFGNDVKLLQEKGVNIEGYDKHYFPEFPSKIYDTILCLYVLLSDERSAVFMELSHLIKQSGKVFIAVRRDVQFEGFRAHKIHQKKTYRCDVILSFKSIF